MKYQGYWFWDLRNDKIIQAKDLNEEYVLLNCPQECEGPFKNEIIANEYKRRNPNLSKDYLDFVSGLYEFCEGIKYNLYDDYCGNNIYFEPKMEMLENHVDENGVTIIDKVKIISVDLCQKENKND